MNMANASSSVSTPYSASENARETSRPAKSAPLPDGVRTILHVDMDAFYVAVETLLDPTLLGKAVIVGGEGARGVVASCSYEARAYGVRSAMASSTAKRLCPHAVFVRGNHGLYGEYSEKIHEIFARFSPYVEGIALDEAFLDVSGSRRLHGSGSSIAAKIRATIGEELGLPCSVGVATSKLIAKLASKLAKPPIGTAVVGHVPGGRRPSLGVLTVPPGLELTFLHPQPVRSLWGVGPKTFERLQRFGVLTIGDLAAVPLDALVSTLGPASGAHLHTLSHARDDRPIEPTRDAKSIGHEETFSEDHFELPALERELLRLADAVASRSRAAGMRGRTIQLKVKLSDFRLLTRSKTVAGVAETTGRIHEVAVSLLRETEVATLIGEVGARLIGISVSNFTDDGEQMAFFTPANSGVDEGAVIAADPEIERELTGTIDAIRAKFGAAALGPATLADRGKLRVKRQGDTQWGPVSK
jgi:DNA polymerase IV